MSKYEKKGTITFSPTAITDKEEVHDLYKRTESGCECPTTPASSGFAYDAIIRGDDHGEEWVLEKGSFEDLKKKITSGQITHVLIYKLQMPYNIWYYPILNLLWDDENDMIRFTTFDMDRGELLGFLYNSNELVMDKI